MTKATSIGPYQKDIITQLGCSPQDAAIVEGIMRNHIFHSTLDWQSRQELDYGAQEAWVILEENREMFEEDFTAKQKRFERLKAQERNATEGQIESASS